MSASDIVTTEESADDPSSSARGTATTTTTSSGRSSVAVFLVLRRMRAPLIVLITTFAISVFGLTLISGTNADGTPWRMDVFDAFYFMSYTASTIGFGELPKPFNANQRMWVTICIYLTVIAWAYAIGTVLALLQDAGFRRALSAQRFARRVAHLRDPFLLVVGYGQAGELVVGALDDMNRRVVVLDPDQDRIDALDLASYRTDVPGYTGDARNPEELQRAGLDRSNCEGVVVVSGDDEANLAVVMTASLLHPHMPVIASARGQNIATRMAEFGTPNVIDPLNLFGDELMLAVIAPHTYQLVEWLIAAPESELPPQPPRPEVGRWIVCGYGRFGSHLTHDLRRHGVNVTVIDPIAVTAEGVQVITGRGTDPNVLARADLADAVGFAAATGNDTTNLSLTVAARAANPQLYMVARQNKPSNAPLFEALDINALLVPARLIAHEVVARIGTPMLWRFVQAARRNSDAWSKEILQRLLATSPEQRPDLWAVSMDTTDAPALAAWLATGEALLGDLLRDPQDREQALGAVVLILLRGDQEVVAPGPDTVLQVGDRMLLAGQPFDRRALDTTLCVPAATEYVVNGRRVGNSWIWRTLVNRN